MFFRRKSYSEKMQDKAAELQKLKDTRTKSEGMARMDDLIAKEKGRIEKAHGTSSGSGWKGKLKHGLQQAGKRANEFEQNQKRQTKKKKDPFDTGLFNM